MSEMESVRKKFEDIDSDLNSFIQSIREIKEIRNSVGALPERLKQSEQELENQRNDLDRMMSSSNNLLMTFEEQSKGIIFDLEKKTELLTNEVKSSIAQITNIFSENNGKLKDQYSQRSEEISKKYDDLKQSFEILKNVVGDQQQTVNTLKSNYLAVSELFEKMEPSLVEMKKRTSELQSSPGSSEASVKKVEKRLEELIYEKNAQQKVLTLSVFIVLLTGFLYFLLAFYAH